MMKNRLFIITTILLPVFCTATGYSVQNPSVNNPVGTTTRPQSYYKGGGLVNTSRSGNTSGNEIVTGNVRRGVAFQGNVPYKSTSSFNASLGSSNLSSFMRDSAGSEDISSSRSRYTTGSNYQSYHLPSSTVTTMSQNTPGTATPGNTTINNQQHVNGSQASQNQLTTTGNTQGQSPALWHLYNPGLSGTQSRYNTLSRMRSESSSLPTNQQQEYGKYRQDETAAYQQYRQESLNPTTPDNRTNTNTQNTWNNQQYAENQATARHPLAEQPLYNSQQNTNQYNQLQQEGQTTSRYDFSQNASPTTASQQSDSTGTQQFVPPIKGYQTLATGEFDTSGTQTSLTPGRPGAFSQFGSATQNTMYQPNTDSGRMAVRQYQKQTSKYPATQETSTAESLAQIQRQLDDLIRSIDNRYQTPGYDTDLAGTTEQRTPVPYQDQTSYRTGQYGYGSSQIQRGLSGPSQSQGSQYGPSGTSRSQQGTSRLTELKELSEDEIAARAQNIMERYESYDSYSQAKFNQLYRAAEGHLNIGRFNQAADAFALASIYKPEDPLCYAGRGHALFAAGEYVSSALHLIRAIELNPEYAQTQIDLAELLGGPDKLNAKIADLNKWLQKSDAPGLGFLLGYVYYRTGRLYEAKQVMDVVTQEMPYSKAATTLKMAIESRLSARQ